MDIALAAIIGYLLGSVPTGLLVGRLSRKIDVRDFGSGKTGATNVLRVLGVKYALVVVVADVGKAVAAVLIAKTLGDSQAPEITAGLAVVVAHTWPVYAGFRGGRGVLPALGALLALEPVIAVTGLAVALGVAAVTRYVAAGSIVSALVAMLYASLGSAFGGTSLYHTAAVLAGGTFIIYQHRENALRLLKGTERRLGQRAEGAKPENLR